MGTLPLFDRPGAAGGAPGDDGSERVWRGAEMNRVVRL
jgi:hypothetical protein